MIFILVIALFASACLAVSTVFDRQLNDPQLACQKLSQTLTKENGTIFPTDGASYEDFEDENYSAICRLPAACIINPSNTQEVATVVEILAEYQTKFAIRGGGHNYIPGFASVNESGVLISLSQLNSITLSEDETSVGVGPGNRWQAVYEALVPKGLMVIGGRVGPVGVGGLVLGGGLSYFATAYGLSLDNVKSFEVVLGDGSIAIASADNEHADLYKALRGGGSNFGIVTSYELYTHPIGNISIDARAYSPNQTVEFFNALAEYQKEGQLDSKSSATVQILETGPTLLMLYADAVQQPQAFAPFYALEQYQAILPPSNGSLLDVLAISGSRFVTGEIRVYGETFSHISDGDLMNELYNIYVEETANLPVNVTGTWVPNPVAASVAAIGAQYGGNLLGLSEVAQVWYETYITYQDPAHDDIVREVTERFTQRCIAAAQERNLELPYLFANTAGREQKVLESYGAQSVAYMRTVAAKYDDGSVFQTLQNDGFLLRDISQ
ncbi:FAD-binding domain-containing protein [Xylariaceae sp. FL1651]|nr:FAD-binding domain-containing protein [Xylariaceae sp. FL1651]